MSSNCFTINIVVLGKDSTNLWEGFVRTFVVLTLDRKGAKFIVAQKLSTVGVNVKVEDYIFYKIFYSRKCQVGL